MPEVASQRLAGPAAGPPRDPGRGRPDESGNPADLIPSAGRHERFVGIQALRFIAALLVVVTHSSFYASERLGAGSEVWSRGVRGVDIFFVISGFVMYVSGAHLAERPRGALVFVERRLTRIVPLYWLVTTVKLAVMLLSSRLVLHARLDPLAILCSYLFIPYANLVDGKIEPLLGVGWTLNFEMAFYALFALALWLRVEVVSFLTLALLPFALGSLLRQPDWPSVAFYLDPILLEFAFGLMIGWWVTRRRSVGRLAWGALVVGFAVLLFGPTGQGRIIDAGIPAAMIVFGTASLEGILARWTPRALVKCGTASYSLYLTHPLIAPVVPVALGKLHLLSPALSVTLSVALAVACSLAVYDFVERPLCSAVAKRVAAARVGWGRQPT